MWLERKKISNSHVLVKFGLGKNKCMLKISLTFKSMIKILHLDISLCKYPYILPVYIPIIMYSIYPFILPYIQYMSLHFLVYILTFYQYISPPLCIVYIPSFYQIYNICLYIF